MYAGTRLVETMLFLFEDDNFNIKQQFLVLCNKYQWMAIYMYHAWIPSEHSREKTRKYAHVLTKLAWAVSSRQFILDRVGLAAHTHEAKQLKLYLYLHIRDPSHYHTNQPTPTKSPRGSTSTTTITTSTPGATGEYPKSSKLILFPQTTTTMTITTTLS